MAAATSASASRSTPCSRRSISTRSPIPGGSTLRSALARATTRKRALCSPHSTSRSGSEDEVLKRGTVRRETYGEEEFDREEQSATQDGETIRQPARRAEKDRAR